MDREMMGRSSFSIPDQLKRFCVFCGREPTEKTNEHILPKWLLRLTGDEKRKICVGWDAVGKKRSMLSAVSYVFPACAECNNQYSKLEIDAQRALTNLLENQPIYEESLSRLLDWFDKIRVGLWLGDMVKNPSSVFIRRKFHITQRVGQNDRCLLIGRSKESWQGFHLYGTHQPLFHFMPSCFGIAINGLYFINISSGFLFSHRLGLPTVIERMEDESTGHIQGTLIKGRLSARLPLTRLSLPENFSSFFQPCYEKSLVQDEVFRELIKPFTRGVPLQDSFKGQIYNENGVPAFVNNGTELILSKLEEARKSFLNYLFIKAILKIQLELLKYSASREHWSPQRRKSVAAVFKTVADVNRKTLSKVEEQVRREERSLRYSSPPR